MAEGAWLRVVSDQPTKEDIAALIAEGDRRQAAEPAFRRELAAWMRPNRTRARDGMPGYAHGLGDIASVGLPLVIRALDWGKRQAAKDRRLALRSPAVLIVGTENDSPLDWLRAGQAVGLLLLRACAGGVAASFLNQPIEVAALRPQLARKLGAQGFPQILLRVGYGPEVRPTPRRELTDVITA